VSGSASVSVSVPVQASTPKNKKLITIKKKANL
jgi:hypothetical protein